MFEGLKGKKLLVLGSTIDDCQIIDAAKSMGIFTITTDNHNDWSDAPAKYIADEAWNISWTDIPVLKEKCLESGIDGVMAGYSEFRIDSAIKLSKALGTRFYVEDEKVLDKTFDKRTFKNVCRENNVPVTADYYIDFDNYDESLKRIKFPVIIKPADNAGSRGIRACFNANDLHVNIEYALSFSSSKNVVIEELIKGGREIVIYYTIADGEVAFSAICDKFERVEGDGFNALPDAYIYPSVNTLAFLEKHNIDVINTIKSMGIRDGSVNLQGFFKSDGTFAFFEMDYRPGGTSTFHFTEHFNNVNYLKMMISFSLTGDMHREVLYREDPLFKGNYACVFTLLSRNGTITKQSGDDEVAEYPNVLHTCFYHRIGTEIVMSGSQYPKTFRAYIVGKHIEEIQETIRKIQETVIVEDKNNINMLYSPFDIQLLNIYDSKLGDAK